MPGASDTPNLPRDPDAPPDAHAAARDLVIESLLADLAPPARAALDAHLAACPACRAFAAAQLSLESRLALALAAPEPSAGLDRRIRERLATAPEPRFAWREILPDLASVTGVALLAAGGAIALPAYAAPVAAGVVLVAVLMHVAQTLMRSAAGVGLE